MNQDQLKSAVAKAALEYIQPKLDNDSIIGIGTGSTANFFIDHLAEIKHQFDGAVASSEATAAKLKSHGIPVYDLGTVDQMEFYIDGADETNAHLQLIKGGGGEFERHPSKAVELYGYNKRGPFDLKMPQMQDAARRLKPDETTLSPQALRDLWTGAREDAFEQSVVMATAGAALFIAGAENDLPSAEELAKRLWDERRT